MSRQLKFGNKIIDDNSPMYVIAEIGNNHQGELDKAKELFKAAKDAGADAVKLQKRDNTSLFTQAAYDAPYDNPNSFGDTYGSHREFLELGWPEFVELKDYAAELDILFFSTAFDIPSADFLEKLDMPAYKIASGDLRSLPLIKHVASFGKPYIVSTGGGTMDDVRRMHDELMPINDQLCIMQCTAGYPPEWDQLNLRVIETYREAFPDTVIGFSSHDSGIAMSIAGYMLGARMIEKHFTLNRAMKGTDHSFSLEPQGLEKMVRDLQRLDIALGDGQKATYDSEVAPVKKMSKSLFVARDITAGNVLASDDITMKSPGGGIPPYELDNLIGRTVNKDLEKDAFFDWDDIVTQAMQDVS
ncbi:MAG: N-acetylneuraminate synthase family protein [Pseudomonadota bacterium]